MGGRREREACVPGLEGVTPRYEKGKALEWVRAIYNAPDLQHGYSLPQLRDAVKRIMATTLRDASEAQVWDYWESRWKRGGSFDEKMLAVAFWSERRRFALACRHWERLMGWAADLTNWAHSDGLSSVYVRFLETLGRPVDEMLGQWNSSGNPWLRRQSVVSLLYYTRQRKRLPGIARVLAAVQPLLGDEHHYVQKGVGWTLREAYQVDEACTLGFIRKHLHAITPAAYSAAVEKLPEADRRELRLLRAGLRQSREKPLR